MKSIKIIKYLIMFFGCLGVCFSGVACAGNVNYYADLLKSGRYKIIYNIDCHNITGSSHMQRYMGEGISANDDALDYYEFLAFNPNEKNPYYFLRLQGIDGVLYYSCKADKKPFDKTTLKKYKISISDMAYHMVTEWPNRYRDFTENEMFSSLGPVIEQAGFPEICKTEFVKSGQEKHGGKTYEYDEYKMVYPYAAALRLYYFNGELKKCIKIFHGRPASSLLPEELATVQTGYVIVDIEKFDSEIDEYLLKTK